jgi:hypothetical protein
MRLGNGDKPELLAQAILSSGGGERGAMWQIPAPLSEQRVGALFGLCAGSKKAPTERWSQYRLAWLRMSKGPDAIQIQESAQRYSIAMLRPSI